MSVVLTIQQVADRWQVSRQAVQRMLDKKKLKSFKAGRGRRVPMAEVERVESCGGRRTKAAAPLRPVQMSERYQQKMARRAKLLNVHGR